MRKNPATRHATVDIYPIGSRFARSGSSFGVSVESPGKRKRVITSRPVTRAEASRVASGVAARLLSEPHVSQVEIVFDGAIQRVVSKATRGNPSKTEGSYGTAGKILIGAAIGAVVTHIAYRHWPVWCSKPPMLAWPS